MTALRLATTIKPEGLGHIAIVCSNLVYLARSKTGRCIENQYWGNADFEKVFASNMMITRMVAVIIVRKALPSQKEIVNLFDASSFDPMGISTGRRAEGPRVAGGFGRLLEVQGASEFLSARCGALVVLRVRWVIEQPASSILKAMKFLETIPSGYGAAGGRRVVFGNMGAHGARTKKPTYWVGDWPEIPMLKQTTARTFEPTDLVRHVGPNKVSGVPTKVNQTQGYTKQYGEFVFKTWKRGLEARCGLELAQQDEIEASDSDDSLSGSEFDNIAYPSHDP